MHVCVCVCVFVCVCVCVTVRAWVVVCVCVCVCENVCAHATCMCVRVREFVHVYCVCVRVCLQKNKSQYLCLFFSLVTFTASHRRFSLYCISAKCVIAVGLVHLYTTENSLLLSQRIGLRTTAAAVKKQAPSACYISFYPGRGNQMGSHP